MLKIISIITLIYMINILDANHSPSITQVEEPLQSKPCTRHKDNIDVWGPSSQIPTLNNNFNTLDIASKPVSLKTNNYMIENPESDKILLHNHEDFGGNHLILTQTRLNNEEADTANSPRPFLIGNLEERRSLFPIKPESNNEPNNEFSFDDNFELKYPNNYDDPRKALFNKIKQKKTENSFNIIVKKPSYITKTIEIQKEKPSNEDIDDCVSIKNKNNEVTSNNRRFFTNPKQLKHDIPTEVIEPNVNADETDESNRIGFENNELLDPTIGAGITDLSSSPVNLLRHSRVCYACSTVNNPTCQQPDRRTTVKYCRHGYEACVTKTFLTSNNNWILTRDCGKSCDDTDILVQGPKYKSCSVCHTDMCNDSTSGATATNTNNFIICSIFVLIVKYSL